MSKNNGGPAFPSPGVVLDGIAGQRQQGAYEGMTLRDYFAAKALNGILSNPLHHDADPRAKHWDGDFSAAKAAYEWADAMLESRQPKQEGCQNCGDTGIHACTGKPIEPMTGEKKEELSKALEKVAGRDADGWIEWNGGECPVSNETMVEVRLRTGEQGLEAEAHKWHWGHSCFNYDIIAYRVVKEGVEK